MNANLYALFAPSSPSAASPACSTGRADPPVRSARRGVCALCARAGRAGCVPATGSPCRSRSTGRRSRSTSRACAPGFVYLPLNTGYPKARARVLLRRRRAARHRLPARARGADRRAGVRRRDGHARQRAATVARTGRRARDIRGGAAPDDLAAILYTSGTTGARRARCSPTATSRRTRDAGQGVGLHARRRAAARAADLPRPRAVRRDALRAAAVRACFPAEFDARVARCCRARRC